MKTVDIINRISKSDFVNAFLPLEIQLGIPYLELIKGKLCMVFLPHRENRIGNQIELFSYEYKMAYVYPFHRLVLFENLYFNVHAVASKSILISDNRMLNLIVYGMENLYREYDRLFAQMDKNGPVTEVMVKKCQQAYYDFLEQNGLISVYCQTGDELL